MRANSPAMTFGLIAILKGHSYYGEHKRSWNGSQYIMELEWYKHLNVMGYHAIEQDVSQITSLNLSEYICTSVRWGLHLLIFWFPRYPWVLCKGTTWPQFLLLHILYFNSKGSHQIASIFDLYIHINERVDLNHSLIPPPSGPQIGKYVNVFIYEKLIIHCFPLCLCLQCDEVFMTLWCPWIQHTVPQDPKQIITN